MMYIYRTDQSTCWYTFWWITASGYFARWAAVRKLIDQFLDCKGITEEKTPLKKQILSFGAGFDTMYFQLKVHEFVLSNTCTSSKSWIHVEPHTPPRKLKKKKKKLYPNVVEFGLYWLSFSLHGIFYIT